MPVWQSILLRGDHGIGKSQIVYQLAKHFALPVVERRLSQMSEGDMIGLPKLDNNETKFMPPDWYVRCCKEPCVLFLDELNRATPEVMQAAFQIVLDRTLNGHVLHPGTRIFSAINTHSRYNVNMMDPALLDRFWVSELEPTTDDWLAWARTTKVHPFLVDFIAQQPRWLDTAGKNVDYDKVQPSRRSWERVGQILEANKLFDSPENETFYSLSMGLIGVEAAAAFKDFVMKIDRQVSAEDILNKWSPALQVKIEGLGQERWNVCIEKVGEKLASFPEDAKKSHVTPKQAKNLAAFMKMLPGELRIALWSKIAVLGAKQIETVKACHVETKDLILEVFNNPADVEKLQKAQEEKAKAAKK